MRPWRTAARRTLLSRPPWMEVGDESVVLPDGRTIDGFLWVRTRDFAMVVPVTARDEIVAVRSYKHGTRTVALSLPAGYLEEGEDPLTTAKRELKEETGYEAEAWSSLGKYVVDGNYGVATEHIFLARGARSVSVPNSGDLEEMEIVLVPRAEVRPLLARGEVAQLSSAAAFGLALAELDQRAPRPTSGGSSGNARPPE
jgi:ADP-ribose pyrophosphatase